MAYETVLPIHKDRAYTGVRYWVATHNGKFHADELIGISILRFYLEFGLDDAIRVARTRAMDIIDECDFAVDVGHGELDHHHENFSRCRENGVPYASAGLTWEKYGLGAIVAILSRYKWDKSFLSVELQYHSSEFLSGKWRQGTSVPPEGSVLGEIWKRIDVEVIQPADLNDNGKSTPNGWSYASVVGPFNPPWFENDPDAEDKAFEKAAECVYSMLEAKILSVAAEVIAKADVDAAVEAAAQAGTGIMVLERGVPWKAALCNHPKKNAVLFAVVKSRKDWHVNVVPVEANSFKAVADLPMAWKGKEYEVLQEVTGVPDATFCHRDRFVAAAKSFEGAMALAKMAVEEVRRVSTDIV